MARILIPLPARDYDPTEAAVSWRELRDLGHTIVFATPAGAPAEADDLMLHGRGLDPWGFVPGLDRLVLVGRLMRANDAGRAAYDAMAQSPEWRSPIRWNDARESEFDGLLLPGGHRARGMREYLESPVLQALAVAFFRANKPVGAVCHGVVLLARSTDPATGRSVLYGRKTTALTWALEKVAVRVGRIVRWWDPAYYSTYPEEPGEPVGYRSVQAEVVRAWLTRPISVTCRRTRLISGSRPVAAPATAATIRVPLSWSRTGITSPPAGRGMCTRSQPPSRAACRAHGRFSRRPGITSAPCRILAQPL